MAGRSLDSKQNIFLRMAWVKQHSYGNPYKADFSFFGIWTKNADPDQMTHTAT